MKKFLLTLAAIVAMATSALTASAEMTSVTLYNSGNHAYGNLFRQNFDAVTQILYPASALDKAIGEAQYTVEEIAFPICSGYSMPSSGKAAFTVYLAKNTSTSTFTSQLPASDFTLVSSIVIDFANYSGSDLRFTLDDRYLMSAGENLIVGIVYQVIDELDRNIYLNDNDDFTPGRILGAIAPSELSLSCPMSDQNGQYGPAFTIGYEAGNQVGGSGDEQPEITETVLYPNAGSYANNTVFSNIYDSSVAQIMYPQTVLGARVNLDEYTVERLTFPLATGASMPTSGKAMFNIYLAKNTESTFASTLPLSQYTLVYSHVIDFAEYNQSAMVFDLDKYFTLARGENLIVATSFEKLDGASITITLNDDPNLNPGKCYTASGLDLDNATYSNSQYGPQLMLGYQEGKVEKPGDIVDKVDVSATVVTGPVEKVYVNKEYTYQVQLLNLGTKVVTDYSGKVYDKANPEKVYATFTGTAPIPADYSVQVPVNVTFTEVGEVELVAEVTVEGDEDADNNVSQGLVVKVQDTPYKAVKVEGLAAPQIGEEVTYSVVVKNQSEEELAGYIVEFYAATKGLDPVLVAKSTSGAAIAAGQEGKVDFNYTFPLSGEYQLKGVVYTVDTVDDQVVENERSETPVFDVNIPLDGLLSPVINGTYPSLDGAAATYGDETINRNYDLGATQTIYKASYFGPHENAYQIQTLGFTVAKEAYAHPTRRIKVALAQVKDYSAYGSGSIDASKLVPEDAFTLVYDGPYTTVQDSENFNLMTLKLQNTFTLENGNALVVNIVAYGEDGTPYLELASVKGEEAYQVYTRTNANVENYSLYNNGGANIYASKSLPCLTIGYALEPLPAKVDLAVGELTVTPEGKVNAGDEVSFKVELKNVGTVEIEEYTLELVSLAQEEGAQDVVLETYDGTRYLAVNQTANQTVKYTFDTDGEYNLVVRAITADDVDLANNTSAAHQLVVDKLDGVEGILAEGTLSYDAATATVNVNLGAGTLFVTDMAGRLVARHDLDGAAKVQLRLNAGVYVISINGKSIKIAL